MDPGDGAGGASGTPTSRVAGSDSVAVAIGELKTIDRSMAGVLRAVAETSTVQGMAGERLISLATSGTSWDLKLIRRITQTLNAMPLLWTAFDDGRLSWGQLRSVALSARDLSVADREVLDAQLVAAIAQNATAEPDRLCDIAADLAGRLTDARLADKETASQRRSGLWFLPQLFGGTAINGHLDDVIGDTIVAGLLDAAPDPANGPLTDANGRTVPGSWAQPDSLQYRLAIGLYRLARAHLNTDQDDTAPGIGQHDAETAQVDQDQADDAAGASSDDAGSSAGVRVTVRRPGTHAHVIVDLVTLAGDASRTDAATSRLLWRLAGGRRTLSRARASFMSCDAMQIPVLTDGPKILAVGDAHDPIPLAVRRAAAVRDQGCRFPGCSRPQADTDLHHIIFRRNGGPTCLANLPSLCEHCHNLVHKNGWQLSMDADGILTVQHGRWRFTSRPRLRPPPPDRLAQPSARPSSGPTDRPAHNSLPATVHDPPDDHSPPGAEIPF